MDIDGNGQVSYQELLQTAKQSMEASKKMSGEHMPREVLQVRLGTGLLGEGRGGGAGRGTG